VNPARPGQTVPAQPAQPGSTGAAQPGNTTGTLTFGPLQSTDVRRSLNITDEQWNRINQSNTQLQTQFRDDLSRLNALTPAERATRWQEIQGRYNTQFLRSAGDVLNPEQMNRLRQLDLQYQGVGAFGSADVQRRLNLTADQQRQLRDIEQQYRRDLDAIRTGSSTNREDAMRRWNDLQRQMQGRTNAILNAEQRQTWTQMTGQPFTYTPDFLQQPNR